MLDATTCGSVTFEWDHSALILVAIYHCLFEFNKPNLCAVFFQTTHFFCASAIEQGTLGLKLYRTEAINPRHTSEAGMRMHANIVVVAANPRAIQIPCEYNFQLNMQFGDAEFIATALDMQSLRTCVVQVILAVWVVLFWNRGWCWLNQFADMQECHLHIMSLQAERSTCAAAIHQQQVHETQAPTYTAGLITV